jgi:hypothetical protein
MRGAFGNDTFGRIAEKAARFFGTPQYIVGQTLAVVAWVVLNSTQLGLGFAWDVYPFIALNLLFSLQAAYAAPLILLAQTRQADLFPPERSTRAAAGLHSARRWDGQSHRAPQSGLTLQDKQLTEQVADLTKPRAPARAARAAREHALCDLGMTRPGRCRLPPALCGAPASALACASARVSDR